MTGAYAHRGAAPRGNARQMGDPGRHAGRGSPAAPGLAYARGSRRCSAGVWPVQRRKLR
jgi:hypothetical protein